MLIAYGGVVASVGGVCTGECGGGSNIELSKVRIKANERQDYLEGFGQQFTWGQKA